MSRIGNKPVVVPDGVTIEAVEDGIRVKGPKGTLFESIPTAIRVEIADGKVTFRRSDDRKDIRALHGLARALVANMVHGVTAHFSRELEIQGVGYRAEVSGTNLNLSVGYSHPVALEIPKGLNVSVERNVVIRIDGIDRNQLGQFAADIRKIRPPEPYKGKGIRYADEHVRRKVGKAGASGS